MANFLNQFGLQKHGEAFRKISTLWPYINNESARDFDNGSHESKIASSLASSLNNKSAKFAYYSFNPRTIPEVPQTGHSNGVNLLFSDKPLSNEFMDKWEINRAVHSDDTKAPAEPAPSAPKPEAAKSTKPPMANQPIINQVICI